ncbi:MAG: hypothetical protein JW900_15345 [Anaerolineae bacterium]|nr:hypothetical protein [Anaerolineae bacterium]
MGGRGRVFDDESFAQRYAEQHQKMAAGFGREYAAKLARRGFAGGKIVDRNKECVHDRYSSER